jgi:MFS family permease
MHKNIKLLSVFNFLTDFSFFSPVAIIYFSRVSGSFALGMSIFSIAMISSAVFEIPTGVFSDRIGRKKTLVLGSIALLLAIIFYALGFSYWYLIIGALFEGLSRAFYSGNNDALLYDTLRDEQNEKEFHEYLGKTSSFFQFASAISAGLGAVIAYFSFPLAVWLTVIPKAIGVFVGLKIEEPKTCSKESSNLYEHLNVAIKEFVKNKKLRLLSLSSIISYSLNEPSYQFRSAFINTLWPVWAIGTTNIISSLGAAIGYLYSGKLIKKFGELKNLIAGTIYGKIVNIVALVYPTVFSPLIMTTSSPFFGTTEVAKTSLLQKEFTDSQRATMSSLNSFASSLAFGVVSFGLGFIADKIGPAKALLTTTILGIPIIFIYLYLYRKEDSSKIN